MAFLYTEHNTTQRKRQLFVSRHQSNNLKSVLNNARFRTLFKLFGYIYLILTFTYAILTKFTKIARA